jgi:hypothetical protein
MERGRLSVLRLLIAGLYGGGFGGGNGGKRGIFVLSCCLCLGYFLFGLPVRGVGNGNVLGLGEDCSVADTRMGGLSALAASRQQMKK